VLFNQHFTGTMDHWDPAVTDGLGKDREVILFNNAGVSSSGEAPTTIDCEASGLGRHRAARRSRDGYPHARSAGDLRRHL
jgi:hypothetical protein